MAQGPATWHVAVPWLRSATEPWRLTRFVPNAEQDLRFVVSPAHYYHDRSRKHSGLSAWADYFRQGNAAWAAAQAAQGSRGNPSQQRLPQLARRLRRTCLR